MKLSSQDISEELTRVEHAHTETLADEIGLWAWGRWARSGERNLGYPPCLLQFVAKQWAEKNLQKFVPKIDDAEGMRIEAAVTALDFSERKVIQTIYQYCVPMRKVPETLSWSRHRVDQLHGQALGDLRRQLKGRLWQRNEC